ncbi:MAG TPA: hypothetical protein V6D33_12055 [Cyanophyceae cyanobacterium]
MSQVKRKFGKVNGFLFRVEEVLYVRPLKEDGTEYEIFFKGGHSLLISMVSKRINSKGKEVVYCFSLADIERELGCLDTE